MERTDIYYPSSDGRTKIHARVWKPDGEPKAVLQIIHGMIEFIGRYGDFAAYLADHGYLVVGEDHLGHGESVADENQYGYFGPDGNSLVIRDIHELRLRTAKKYPGIPYMMLGHSMGSFLVRQYIMESTAPPADSKYGATRTNADGLSGVIVMGTGWQPGPVLKLGQAICSAVKAIRNDHYISDFVANMATGSNNKRIPDARTVADWLTKDEEIVDWYMNEDWCQFKFTVNGYYNMFKGIEKCQDLKSISKLPEGLPIFFVSGTEDPVGNYGEAVRKAYMKYVETSKCDVDIKLYEGDRHEILNELDKDVVYADLLDWLDQCTELNFGARK